MNYYLNQIKFGNAIRIKKKNKKSWNIGAHNSENLLKCWRVRNVEMTIHGEGFNMFYKITEC